MYIGQFLLYISVIWYISNDPVMEFIIQVCRLKDFCEKAIKFKDIWPFSDIE